MKNSKTSTYIVSQSKLRSRTMRWLTNHGFYSIELKKSEHGWDIIAHNMKNRVLLVRAKADKIYQVELTHLIRFPCPHKVQKLVFIWFKVKMEPKIIRCPTDQFPSKEIEESWLKGEELTA